MTHYRWKKGEVLRLSKNFTSTEFECSSSSEGAEQCISIELIKSLQAIRDALGKPLIITSGYRTAEYQQMLRDAGYKTAVNKSQHELGNAADISITGGLLEKCEEHFDAIGIANSFIHVDTRRGRKRRWTY